MTLNFLLTKFNIQYSPFKAKPRFALLFASVLVLAFIPLLIYGFDYVRAALGGSNATPVAVWHFDEGVDNTCSGGSNDVCDDTGNTNHDGPKSNATWQTKDKCTSGKCLFFDGTGDLINFGAVSDLGLTGDAAFTISLWVKPISTRNDGAFFSYGSAASGRVITIAADGSGNIYSVHYGNDHSYGTAWELNRWQHVAITYDPATSTETLYVNGTPRETWTPSDLNLQAGDTMEIGEASWNGTDVNTTFIDEVKLFTSTLSADQIKAEYAGGAAVLGTSTSNSEALSEGLVGYWPMDEPGIDSEDEQISDFSGNGNTGTLFGDDGADGDNGTGMDCTVAGKFGTACDTDGTDDYISIGSGIFDTQSSFSISAWVNPDAASTDDIIAGASGFHVGLLSGSSTICMAHWENTTERTACESTLDTGQWHHYVGVYEGDSASGVIRLYKDGQLEQETPMLTPRNNGLFYIGGHTTYAYAFNGQIDDVRMYNRALSPAEVKALYNWAPGPVGYWPMDENTGTTTVYDHSGNGLNGTIAGSMTESDWVPGKFGSALDFDGTNDHLVVSDNDLLDGMAALTVGLWVYVPSDWSATGDSNIIIDKCCSTDEHTYVFQAELSGSSTMQFLVRNSSDSNVGVSFIDFTNYLGQWVYLTGTYDGTTILTYINGVYSGNSNSQSGKVDTNGDSLGIGGRASTSTADTHFYGKIDEVKIYNYARTPQQIVEDMNAGHPAGGSPVGSQHSYWAFDEMTGDTANDTIGTNNGNLLGTCPGSSTCPTWTTGKINGSLSFDGDDDYVTVPNESDYDFSSSQPYSVTAWFKVAAFDIGWQTLIAKGDTAFRIQRAGTSNTLEFGVGSGGNYVTGTTNVNDGDWHHVAGVYDGAGSAYIYLDGNTDVSGSATAGTNDDPVYIAENSNGPTSSRWWEGQIDEVKIYTSALTQEQVLIDMNANSATNFGTGTNEKTDIIDGAGSPPVGYWPMDENTGTSTTYDKSGNGYNSSMNGSMTESDWVRGKYGSALDFDGSNDYLSLGTSYSGSTNFSVSGWVNMDSTSISTYLRPIFIKGTSSSGDSGDFGLTIGASSSSGVNCNSTSGTGHFQAHVFTSTGNYYCATDSSSVATDTWVHLGATFDGTTLILYKNGVQVASTTPGGTFGTNANPSTVGAWTGDISTTAINAQLDEVKIFDYALTPAQIAYDYNRGAPIAWWQFDDNVSGDGQTVYDASGNGNNGVTEWGSGSGMDCTVSGKLNTACSFDGSDDYVNIYSTSLNSVFNGNYGTLTAWVKVANAGVWTDSTLRAAVSLGADINNTVRIYKSSTNNQLDFERTGGGSNKGASTTTTSTDWINLAITWDDTVDEQRYYINGDLIETDTSIGTYTGSLSSSRNTIGGHTTSPTQLWDGQIDDVRIYNYALSGAQIKKIMLGGSAAGSATFFGPETGSP